MMFALHMCVREGGVVKARPPLYIKCMPKQKVELARKTKTKCFRVMSG